MLETHQRQGDRNEQIEHHHEVTDVFVVDDRVDGESEGGQDQKARKRHEKELLEIENELDVVKAFQELGRDARHHHQRHQQHLDREERAELGGEEHPATDRQRVDDFGNAGVALAPGELAGVEGGDDQHEKGKTLFGELEHLVSERVRLGAVEGFPVEHGGHHEKEPRQDEHQKEDVLDRLTQLKKREPKEERRRRSR